MTPRQFCLLILLSASHSVFGQMDTSSFPIILDSLEIKVTSWPKHLSTTNTFDNGRTIQIDYHLEKSRVVFATAKLIIRAANGLVIDSSKTQTWDMSIQNKYSLKFENVRIEVNIMSDSAEAAVITIVNNGENAYKLKYFFKNENLEAILAQDQSRRYVDTIAKYDNKIVSFVTTINNPRESDKKGHDEYWINNYLITIDEKTMKKIRGKNVRITGNVTFWIGNSSPYRERFISNTGREVIGQGLSKDIKLIPSPLIEVLKD